MIAKATTTTEDVREAALAEARKKVFELEAGSPVPHSVHKFTLLDQSSGEKRFRCGVRGCEVRAALNPVTRGPGALILPTEKAAS